MMPVAGLLVLWPSGLLPIRSSVILVCVPVRLVKERVGMSQENVELIRKAYEAYSQGDMGTMLQFVDRDLAWTYLDPSLEDPAPQICHGRHELETALERQAERGLKAQLEEVWGVGDRVMVVVRTPGIDGYRVRKADDRNYAVFTFREGRIVALRDCRDREEAMKVAGIE
jgi:ketosteroid isomerase-like protein